MHIIITDSGVGGLSVFAYAERFLRTYGSENPVRLTYVNASPENDFGYNSMDSRKEKVEFFDRFLQIVSDAYSPDSIYVACNTLAVLFPETRFSKKGRVPVRGIVETGVNRLLRELERFPRSIATIFGTVTTIEQQTYPTLLQLKGIHENRIISQPCPSLADTISEDRQGMRTKEKIEKYVALAIGKAQERTTSYLAYLACTHYGYRKEQFSSAFEGQGVDVMVLNPNELVIDDLFGGHKRKATEIQRNNDVEVEFVTRYKIPKPVLETIAYFLDDVSPKTVQAFTNYTYAPNLF